jgi:hypothetical protein
MRSQGALKPLVKASVSLKEALSGFALGCAGTELEVVVSVTLEELYFGTVKQVSIKKALVDERSKSSKFLKDDILLSLKPGTQDGSR